jgi:3-hydroxyisobutyrate dehydrogenase-like beta-hydroxyacid dehydrogenase
MSDIVGILNPGEMGSSLAAAALATAGNVYWCSQGRSAATRERATKLGLTEITTLAEFCRTCTVILGVCPPHAARTQAQSLIDNGYKGLYLEANAIAPASVQQVASVLQAAAIQVVDGGIVGLPAFRRGSTWLYLSGHDADRVQHCLANGAFETVILGNDIGQASALKMLFAAWNKGRNALLSAILAAAEQRGVREALQQQWDQYDPGFTAGTHKRIRDVARKAWRFTGEMQEIASTLEESGVPGDFFSAAAEVYQRQAGFKDVLQPPELELLLKAIAARDDY